MQAGQELVVIRVAPGHLPTMVTMPRDYASATRMMHAWRTIAPGQTFVLHATTRKDREKLRAAMNHGASIGIIGLVIDDPEGPQQKGDA